MKVNELEKSSHSEVNVDCDTIYGWDIHIKEDV